MTAKYNVLILGYGEMGHAMEYLLAEHHKLYIWDKYPAAGFKSAQLEEVTPLADFVLFCLPVNPHREISELIAPLLRPDCICLSIAKGLDESGQTAAQIFASIFNQNQPYVLLYGPMISEEIRAGRYAFAQAGCSADTAYMSTNDLFSESRLITEKSSDIHGITWSVILKNVYAMIFGVADELSLGDNVRGFLMVDALRELDEIVQKMGGKERSPYNLAGLGDLVTTATSVDSHHHELGRILAREKPGIIEGEGVHTLAMLDKYKLLNQEDYPLYHLIQNIVRKPLRVREQIEHYLAHR